MAFRIEIALKRSVRDARGENITAKASSFFKLPVTSCQTRDVYKLDIAATKSALMSIQRTFTDPVICRSAIGRLPAPAFSWMIEVGFKPGVTDNVGHTAQVVAEESLGRKLTKDEGVYTAIQYFLRGNKLTRENASHIAENLLANPLIHTIKIYNKAEWIRSRPDIEVPVIHDHTEPTVKDINLNVSDEELMRISREGILSLSLEEMYAIRDYFNSAEVKAARIGMGLPENPTDVEIECLAQTWSEHCKHKIFAGKVHYKDENGKEEWIDSLFKTYIKAATEEISKQTNMLVSVFSDNAGIIRFNEQYNVSYKAETHNSPSALDPYGGAITGVVGVNRDPMGTGMGCEMLYNTWGYCLGSPFYKGDLPEGLMHPRRIRDGVHQGVIDGGNQSGIPWARGFERFDDRYIGKPLVYCGTVGRIPRQLQDRPSERKEITPGDAIVMCGGRIGKDGIHGATFSSEELRQESPAQAVQIGDPITQREMYEFLMEARDKGLYRAITDNGAGGLSSSIGEMSRLSGGADLDLAKAPLKYEGLQPWEILLSEAQERMSLAVPQDQVEAFLALAKQREVEATVLGTFTDSGSFNVYYNDNVVARLEMDFLHDGCPEMTLEAEWTAPSIPEPQKMRKGTRDRALLDVLSSLNACSKEKKSRCYDAEVKGLSVVKPFVGIHSDTPSDATVLRVEHGCHDGLVLAEGINPFYSDIDTYHMMSSVIDEAVRRIVSVGGKLGSIAGLDNFCWPDPVESEKTPDGRYKMAQLVRANKALYDVCTSFGVPPISGKDSMKNDSVRGGRKISIPPTVLFSTIGIMKDVRRAVTLHFKQPGDIIYVIGQTRNELGASEFHRLLARRQKTPDCIGGEVPKLNIVMAQSIYDAMGRAHDANLLRSSHTPTLGGLGVALAMTAFGGGLGADVDLSGVAGLNALDNDALLFSESNSRFVVTCTPENARQLEGVFTDLPFYRVGTVNDKDNLQIRGVRGRLIIDSKLEELRAAFKETLHGI